MCEEGGELVICVRTCNMGKLCVKGNREDNVGGEGGGGGTSYNFAPRI